MNKKILTALAAAGLVLGAVIAIKQVRISALEAALAARDEKSDPAWLFEHQRETWLSVLEWCESQGIPSAINPKDNDGTPSFGAFQFKPGTFAGYGKKYGIEGNLMDYATQRAILARMLDDKSVDWRHEFPACTAKYGTPPVKF